MKIEENVVKMLRKSSEIIADFENDSFSVDMYNEITDLEINSPIERIFHIALNTIMRINYLDRSEPIEIDGQPYATGIYISPQEKIDTYRVDFLIYNSEYPVRNKDGIRKQKKSSVIVECDSQQFHETDEKQRRYEKKRDRHFQSKGYTVFHFTGSEIVNEPYRVAADVLHFLTGIPIDELLNKNFID